jgi:pimeloyl-ACP methyl ester carboxylesterase
MHSKRRTRLSFWLVVALSASSVLCPRAPVYGQSGEAPPPVDQVVRTKDNVQLTLTYYPSTAGRDAVPVVMLHDFNETRAVFAPLALALQNPPIPEAASQPKIEPRAVITVDLRGHGDSKAAIAPDGSPVELTPNRLRPADFEAMVLLDMEAVRSFLVQQNDAGALNLNKLTIVGSGMGANVALLWAAKDWATPPLPTRKQGQDVKALALLSPRWNYNGLMLANAMKFPPIQRRISILLAYGTGDRDVVKDAENMQKTWSRFHPAPPPDKAQQIQDFVVLSPKTNLQGTKLLNSEDFGVGPRIASFIEAQVARKPFPWVQRKTP